MIPKAELHCHIEGAVSPALAREMARRHNADLDSVLDGDRYRRQNFSVFLTSYDIVANLFRERDDFVQLAYDHYCALARDGCLYAEIFASPAHAEAVGLAPQSYLEGLDEGIARARRDCGIEGRIIVTGVRHLGPDAVRKAAEIAIGCGLEAVTGFGMAGNERTGRPRDYATAFDIAREGGLRLTCHAGEWVGPEGIEETMDVLKVERLGHGVRAAESETLTRRIADEGIVLEVCPGSNLSLGVYERFEDHPFRRLMEAGCRVTLNSDDPPHFQTSLADEYRIGRDVFGLSDGDLHRITRTALEAAFVDGDTRAQLLERLDKSA
ncbi:adenosine deaminase [Notoacmeibacter sp. MSK16QG-6]|uniref:adenosine deaminase n=1 Tax=Notoacmeibacter sp. MSK16QG-6 TaxID=2957982 RepID=UPI00209EFF91|nr:adenosine deaminase [Notoacmeibacter sp. MSK16QG-6]MCP1198197.1 adenosine deaminase [Notoacmeibacter sp. MSK16QG-6]